VVVRQWDWRGWTLVLGVADGAGRFPRLALRWSRLFRAVAMRLRGRERDADRSALELAQAPRLKLVKHDPQAALDMFIAKAPAHSQVGAAGPAGAIAAERWYHTIQLPDGTVTRGRFDHRPLVPHYGLPADMSGMRALDIGTADGFWAFEMERRGADVVALELPHLSDRDFPPPVAPLVRQQADAPPGRRFDLARAALDSGVELVRLAVYDLDPAVIGMFDFVHVGDVLWALRDPVRGLAAIWSVTSGRAHIADRAEARIGVAPAQFQNLAAYDGGWNQTTWWTPSVQTLAQMTLDAGFSEVEALRMYRLATRGQSRGPWRVILQARR
jgi:tRNA (mo5U34)-methyltransferase